MRHVVPNWGALSRRHRGDGMQLFRFIAATPDGASADPNSNILVGEDQTTGCPGLRRQPGAVHHHAVQTGQNKADPRRTCRPRKLSFLAEKDPEPHLTRRLVRLAAVSSWRG